MRISDWSSDWCSSDLAVMIVAPFGDRGQAKRLGPVAQQPPATRRCHDPDHARSPETEPPAEQRRQRADDEEGQPFTDRMRGAPDAVDAAALAVREPRRHRDQDRTSVV